MSTALDGEATSTPVAAREAMTSSELEALAEQTARALLGVSRTEAFRMLDSGELAGQTIEVTLRGIKRLLDA